MTERQTAAWDHLHSLEFKRLLYGGAKGGGKSFLLCVWVFSLLCWMIETFKLEPTSNPIHAGWMGRKQATDFTSTTLQTWRQQIPEHYYQLKTATEKDPKHILVLDRIAVDYGGLDRQESINKFNSAEYGFFAIDQAEETTRDDISVLRGSLRLTIDGKALDYKELYTANPRQCWLRDDFIIDKMPGGVFVPALPKDNPHLPQGYEQTLIDAFGYRPELLAAYLEGDWSQIEDETQVIRDKWLQVARKVEGVYQGEILVCDVARFGDDKTVIMYLKGTQIEHQESHPQSRTTEVSSRLNVLSREKKNCPIIIDSVGVGGGVIDELYGWGRHVIPFGSAEKATKEDKYYNRRAEAWWDASEDFAKANIGCARMTTELRRQLCAPRYELRNGRILIESKDKIKERLGYSPDEADCYVMGLWGIRNVRPQPVYMNIGMPHEVSAKDAYQGWRAGRRSRA